MHGATASAMTSISFSLLSKGWAILSANTENTHTSIGQLNFWVKFDQFQNYGNRFGFASVFHFLAFQINSFQSFLVPSPYVIIWINLKLNSFFRKR